MDWWNDVDLSLSEKTGEKRISDASASSPPPLSASDIKARVSCLPCQHTSARSAFDKGATLWCSWAVESGGKKVWFGGDTGYRAVPHLPKEVDDYGEDYKDLPHCPAFKQIGDLRGPFDLGLIPIGAYDPRYIMSPMHANPFDSVNIFVDTKCKRAMGIHWGTWVLTTVRRACGAMRREINANETTGRCSWAASITQKGHEAERLARNRRLWRLRYWRI